MGWGRGGGDGRGKGRGKTAIQHRDWGDTSTSQGSPRIAGHQGEEEEGFPLQVSEGAQPS